MLGERKERILRAVIDDYIASGEPVGSRTLARRYGFMVSPATIRNEMADLEDSGFLEQPHASAGRVPSDKGYRYYVDHFVRPPAESAALAHVRDQLAVRAREIGWAVRQTARILSEASHFLALVTGPQLEHSRIETLRVLPVREGRALLVLVTDDGFVEHRLIELDGQIPAGEVERMNRLFSERLSGQRMGPPAQAAMKELSHRLRSYGDFVDQALDMLERPTPDAGDRVVVGGTTNILRQPEFRDVEKVQGLLVSLEHEETVRTLLGAPEPTAGARVAIGREISVNEMQDCSVVTASYHFGGAWGQVGVLGPRRMDYAGVIFLVETVAAALSDSLAGAPPDPAGRD